MSDNVPKPKASPVPSADAFFDVDGEETSKVIKLDRVTFWTKLQWAALGTLTLTSSAFIVWALATLGSINTAMAQDKATVSTDHEALVEHTTKDAAEKVVIFQMFEEQRKDTKALYQAVMTKQVQPRLEKDGGK